MYIFDTYKSGDNIVIHKPFTFNHVFFLRKKYIVIVRLRIHVSFSTIYTRGGLFYFLFQGFHDTCL